jgi:hypothetical protein
MKKFVISAILTVGAILSANAAEITGLVNTGSFASGTQDTNYTLNATSFGYVTANGAFPLSGNWLANSADSSWITPTAAQGQSLDPSADGLYSWVLSFDLTGFSASSASFVGKFAADNSAVAKLNGVEIGTSSGFSSFSDFSATSGFNSGINTLEFLVTNTGQNGGNPTGLRVEFTQSNVVSAVPEPETYALMLAGLGLMGAVARRRKAKQV